MKKLLILILIALVLTLTIFTILNGLQIGGLSIWGIKEIQNQNAQLGQIVTEATKLASSTFPSKVSELNASVVNLKQQKTKYEDMVAVSDSDDVQTASQLSNYNIDFLWTEIGSHATSQGVNIDMALTHGTGESNVYDINFTVVGSYVGISEFIRSIEDDSDLAFKVEQFSIKAGTSTSVLQATFVCKNIPIEGISSIDTKANASSTEENSTNTENTTNSTKNQNTTKNANTTNSTNTAK